MRKLICLLLSLSLFAFAGFAQNRNVTMKCKNEPVKEVLQKLETQTGFSFAYKNSDINDQEIVSFTAESEDIAKLLERILKSQSISVQITGTRIVLSKDSNSEKSAKNPEKKVYHGIVSDSSGAPIVGAAVYIVGTNSGVVTDALGNYSIEAIPGKTICVSCIGYMEARQSTLDEPIINFTLSDDNLVLEEAVAIGYGTASKKLISSSIASIKMDEIEQGADIDPVKALQGKITGVSISSASGSPGASPNVIVRGVSTVSGNSAPLYVVDGIPAEKYPAMNAADIESIDVLKDASATAIYGSRANAGVVLITTKSGKAGKTLINVSSQLGVSTVSNDIEMANSQEYINVMTTAINNYNVQKLDAKKLYIPAYMKDDDPSNDIDFNWMDAISRKMALNSSTNLSLSGGTDKINFYVSAGLDTQDGYISSTAYKKWTGRAKFSYKAYKWLKFNLNTSLAYSRRDLAEETSTSLKVIRTAREEQPWYTPYKDDNTYTVMSSSGLCRHNPVMLINEEKWWVDSFQLQGTVSLDITPIKGLKYSPSASVYAILDYETKKLTENHNARAYNSGWSAITQQKDNSLRYVIDNILSYENEWDRLTYSAMIGHSIEKYQYDQFGFASSNYANEAYPSSSLGLVTSGAELFAGDVGFSSYALESYFSRIALNWDNRYILNASIRADGSSRFPKDNRYGVFPSASFAWILSNEKFLKDVNAISELKLRLSAGQTGSMAGIGNWAAMSLISAGGSYNGQSAFTVDAPAQNLKWEKSTKYDIGADLGLFNDRLTVAADYFYSITNDMLYSKPVISATGMTSLTSNIGSADNQGIELGINGRLIDKEVKWDLGVNFSWVKSRLLNLLDGSDQIIVSNSGSNLLGGEKHILKNGEPISSWYMYKFDGLYQYDEEVPEKLYAKGVRAGDCKYHDLNNDGDIDENDRMLVGKATPDFYGGINSSVKWNGLEFNVFCSYSIGNKIFAAWKGPNGVEGTEHLGLASGTVTAPGYGEVTQYFNVSKQAANGFWDGPGTSNTIPRPLIAGVHSGYSYDYNVLTSTRYLEDASYFKIKTVTLAYNLPSKLISKAFFSGIRFYLTIDNALTFTKYDGYDPEASYHANPAHANYGVDFGLSPTMRSYIFGLQFKF